MGVLTLLKWVTPCFLVVRMSPLILITKKQHMIKRTKASKDYTVIHNDFLRDKTLSFQATGLLSYLMSLPDDWKIYIEDLSKRKKNGKHSVSSMMNELIKAGYCKRTRKHSSSGRFEGYDYEVSDKRIFLPLSDLPKPENPFTDKPFTENQSLLSTNSTKYPNNKVFNKDNTCETSSHDSDQKDSPSNQPKENSEAEIEKKKSSAKRKKDQEKEFDRFWEFYGKKRNRKGCLKKWYKLSEEQKEGIKQHLPAYIRSTPDKQFRLDPLTYLNGERWFDELMTLSDNTLIAVIPHQNTPIRKSKNQIL